VAAALALVLVDLAALVPFELPSEEDEEDDESEDVAGVDSVFLVSVFESAAAPLAFSAVAAAARASLR
jgi:hypothetical protein